MWVTRRCQPNMGGCGRRQLLSREAEGHGPLTHLNQSRRVPGETNGTLKHTVRTGSIRGHPVKGGCSLAHAH